ncbi:MAG: caspase family protein [Muribaculaceae bacterium]|nr:caspase family protein [Muribaculaceae bacterium]MDE6754919.1 caspase family protein [Muribaculaceae bacterium]
MNVCSTNRALLVGIGQYDTQKTGWSHIHGDNDVELLKTLLKKNDFNDLVTLTNEKATKAQIVKALTDLAGRCNVGDKVYFHFSGHGQPVRDDNHDEGTSKKYDESIIPYDACRDSRRLNGKYTGQFHLIDDELCPLLEAIKKKLGKDGELMVVVDACFSRGIQKDEITDIDPDLLRYVRGTNFAFTPPGRISVKTPKQFTPGAKMTVITACRENERNFEYKSPNGCFYGSLSYYISILLKDNADFERWRECFLGKNYQMKRIFQSFQHPSIEIFP